MMKNLIDFRKTVDTGMDLRKCANHTYLFT